LQTEAEAHYNLARMLWQAHQDDAARQHLQVALQKDPQMKPARDLLSEMEAPPREVQQTNFIEETPQ
jgi:hypothetical protein